MFQRLKNAPGFTIIEVVIVLAIAGLIFAVIFIAVPQLQAAQRDRARDDAMGRLEAAITRWQSNNDTATPNQNDINNEVIPQYMEDFEDPIGGKYEAVSGYNNASYKRGRFSYHTGWDCNGKSGPKSYRITHELEQGGIQCRDNQ